MAAGNSSWAEDVPGQHVDFTRFPALALTDISAQRSKRSSSRSTITFDKQADYLKPTHSQPAPVMHSCLLIDEILYNIARHLSTSRQSCLDMALCCRSFHEPAMDVLWSDLTCFDPLMTCFSDDFIAVDTIEDRGLTLTRMIIMPVRVSLLKPEIDTSYHIC